MRVFTVLLLCTAAVTCTRQYGSNCKSDFQCDSTKELACIHKKCSCSRPQHMLFDPLSQKCFVRVNSRCSGTVSVDGTPIQECVPDAECIKEGRLFQSTKLGVCKCNQGFELDEDGNCIANEQVESIEANDESILNYECEDNSECGIGMTCLNQACVCIDPEKMIYDEVNKSCWSRLNTTCFLEEIGGAQKICVENAECKPENNLTGLCFCKSGFEPIDDVSCFNSSISTPNPSSTTSAVPTSPGETSTMKSTEELSTTEDESPSTTFAPSPEAVLGQPCDESIGKYCIANAFCNRGKCACEKGFEAGEGIRECAQVSLAITLSHFSWMNLVPALVVINQIFLQ